MVVSSNRVTGGCNITLPVSVTFHPPPPLSPTPLSLFLFLPPSPTSFPPTTIPAVHPGYQRGEGGVPGVSRPLGRIQQDNSWLVVSGCSVMGCSELWWGVARCGELYWGVVILSVSLTVPVAVYRLPEALVVASDHRCQQSPQLEAGQSAAARTTVAVAPEVLSLPATFCFGCYYCWYCCLLCPSILTVCRSSTVTRKLSTVSRRSSTVCRR